MAWWKRDPIDLPKECPPGYVCLTTEQAYKSCFDGGAPMAYLTTGSVGFIVGALWVLLGAKIVQWIGRER